MILSSGNLLSYALHTNASILPSTPVSPRKRYNQPLLPRQKMILLSPSITIKNTQKSFIIVYKFDVESKHDFTLVFPTLLTSIPSVVIPTLSSEMLDQHKYIKNILINKMVMISMKQLNNWKCQPRVQLPIT